MWEMIRKFGLEYCDLPTMLWNVSILLRVLTLNIDGRYQKRIPTSYYVFTIIISVCYFYVYLVSMIWDVFFVFLPSGDMITAMIILSLGIASEIATSKFILIFLYKESMKKIVEGYRVCDSLVTPGSRFSNNILKTLRRVKKRAIVFWSVIIMNGVVYIVKPIVLPGRHLTNDKQIIFGLDPPFESPNYELSYMAMCAGTVFTCYVPANVTALLIVIVGYTEAQMLALSQELSHLWDDAQRHYLKEISGELNNDDYRQPAERTNKNIMINGYIKLHLIDIIKSHTTNLNLLKQVEDVFRGVIATEFLILICGLIAELLGGLENTYIQLPFAIMQVGMDCLTGQKLMDANVKFENALYDCKWENFDVNNMKTVLLMLQNSQKTMCLSAGGITTLNFSCFMSVIRLIYSAYTTLRSTMK